MSSPDNSTVPPLASITDAFGQVWTIEVITNKILLNGIQASNGVGTTILYVNSKIYALGLDSNWYLWDISVIPAIWTNVGQQRPGPIPVLLQQIIVPFNQLQVYLDLYQGKIKFIITTPMQSLHNPLNAFIIIVDMA